MKDRDWCKHIEAEVTSLKDRVRKLEGDSSSESQMPNIIELDIEWPEADVGGLHFNAQKTHGVFERKEDGNYYSRDILIHSARNTDDRTRRDLLSEYLDSETVREAFMAALGDQVAHNAIRIFLPKEYRGVKKYNGVSHLYWLRPYYSGSAANFCSVSHYGVANYSSASAVGGCAPVFCIS
jgi:hypothetical protein